jgi:hypothetical protein
MPERIRGRVAAILNARELVVNVGSDEGVYSGMRFAVLNPKGAEIRDPETNEFLDSVEVPKVVLAAVRIQPKVSVLRTFRTERKNLGGTGSSFALQLFGRPPQWLNVPETLKLSEKPYEAELEETESYVKVGDPVVQVVGDEFLVDGEVVSGASEGELPAEDAQ